MTQAMQQSESENTQSVARRVSTESMEKAGEVASAAGDEARAVVDQARDRTLEFVHDAREKLRVEADEQSRRLASTMRSFSDQLDTMARGQASEGWVPDLSRRVAGTIAKTAESLETRGPEAVLGDLKAFARRRPGMFLAGSMGLGMLVGRIMRAADTKSLMSAAKGDSEEAESAVPRIEPPAPIALTPSGEAPIGQPAGAWR
jgi:hypothetical protein